MKTILSLILIFFTLKAYSQSDSLFKTEPVFYISFTNYDKEEIEFEDIRLRGIDSISISFDELIYGQNSNENKFKERKVVFDRINKFGYKVGPSSGAIIGRSALVAFGIGFILGAIEGKFNPVGDGSTKPTGGDRIGTGFLFGIALAAPTALIATIPASFTKEYEILDISKYNRSKKFEIIKRLIKNGVKENQ